MPSATVTRPPNAIYQRPWLYAAQHAAIFAPQRYAVVEASTKSGKTVGCLVWLLEQAMRGQPGQNFWWIAPTYAQTEVAFRRLKHGLPTSLYTANDGKMTLTLPNQTTLWFKSGERPDGLYGEDVYAAVLDEATRVREASWIALRSTLTATRGPVRIIGNVKGRKNWAYQMARRAEAGEPDMAYAKLTAFDAVAAGILADDEIADARSKLPEAVFKELYLAEASDDGGNPFGLDAIRACVGPLSAAPAVAWGWDLAKSVDWTVGIALDAHGAVCGVQRWQRSWQDTIRLMPEYTRDVPALVDSTGVGDPVLEALQRTRGQFLGFTFSASSKQKLMEGLAVAIQQRAITIPEGPIVLELESFEYTYSRTGVRYEAAEGMHDDCVCALALAVELAGRLSGAAPRIISLGRTPGPTPERTQAQLDAAAAAFRDAVLRGGGWPGGR